MATGPIKILIVEDDDELQRHLSGLIGKTDGVEVLHMAGSMAQAQSIDFQNVDLALLDIGLPDGSGIDLISKIRTKRADARILIFTVFGDQKSVIRAFDAGADGFILKDSGAEEIGEAIRSVINGGAPISARAATFLLRSYRANIQAGGASEDHPKLSPRELELLQYLARGFSYKEAARKMTISPSTISEYATSIYRKLAVNSRGEAVFEAMQHGLIRF